MVAIIPAESENKTISEKRIPLRWSFIALPAIILFLSLILAAFFYRLLPPEVVYRFEAGLPNSWMNRSAIIAWMIIPQFVIVVFAFVILLATTLSTRFMPTEGVPLQNILLIMGNMVVLPQVILLFAMLDIFLYNSYQIHLLPVWALALIVMILGGIILVIFFMRALRQFRGQPGKNLQERK
ncbi:hypothetical protein ACFLWU_06610 [Chloroflexota bacterium]